MDDPAVYGRLILLALLLFCSAFFSGGEVALFSLAPIKVVSLSRKPGVGMVIGRLLENPRRLLVTLLTGNEIVNVSISAVSGYLLHKAGLQGYQAVICTAATVLVLGEITPKTIAFRRSEGYAKLVARPLLAMSYLITPVRIALEAIVVGLMKEDGQAEGEESLERTDIAIMVDEMLQSGELGEQESNTIRVILDLEERRVSEIMTPRTDIFALPVEMTVEQALAPVRGANFSRVPVVREDADHVEGVLYARDLLTAGERDTLGQIARPAIFVPEQQRVDDLIVRLRQERVHLAVVVDEFGGTTGIVTMLSLIHI